MRAGGHVGRAGPRATNSVDKSNKSKMAAGGAPYVSLTPPEHSVSFTTPRPPLRTQMLPTPAPSGSGGVLARSEQGVFREPGAPCFASDSTMRRRRVHVKMHETDGFDDRRVHALIVASRSARVEAWRAGACG
jgi:hypothetical protein